MSGYQWRLPCPARSGAVNDGKESTSTQCGSVGPKSNLRRVSESVDSNLSKDRKLSCRNNCVAGAQDVHDWWGQPGKSTYGSHANASIGREPAHSAGIPRTAP